MIKNIYKRPKNGWTKCTLDESEYSQYRKACYCFLLISATTKLYSFY